MSISTKSTSASQYKAALEDATKEIGEVHTISPLLTSKAKHAICRAEVAFTTATEYIELQ